MKDSVQRMLDYHRAARHAPGAVVLVEQDGTELLRLASGTMQGEAPGGQPGEPMREDALFRVASLTKPVVTVLALMLVDEGRFRLDDPVSRHLPEIAAMRFIDGSAPVREATVRDLMRHTAGLPYGGDTRNPKAIERVRAEGLDRRMGQLAPVDFLQSLTRLALDHEPGAAFRYGYSTDVLGLLVERVLGQRLGDALAERVFGPLGMRETRFGLDAEDLGRMPRAFPEDRGWHALFEMFAEADALGTPMDSGGAGLATTIDDYARFARMLAAGGRHEGGRLVSEALFAEMSRNQLPPGVDGPFAFTGPGFGFGLGLAVREPWGASAYPCGRGELTWSGVTGMALYVDPARHWFALMFSSNTASRLLTRFEFRRAVAA